MADSPGRTVDHRAKDLELLASGNFADLEVVCGDRTWKCHRAILMPRSVWFEKALAGPFEEASTGKVNLDEENSAYVDLALKYIYGEGLDVESSVSPEHFVETCVSLWHIADFLLLDPLKPLMQKAVHNYCHKRMKQSCTNPCRLEWTDVDDNSKLSPWALDLVSGVRESYRWNCQHLKAVLMEFLWVLRFSTMRKGCVSVLFDHLKDTNFGDDFLGHYAVKPWIDNRVWAPAPLADSLVQILHGKSKCRGCLGDISWATGTMKEGQTFDPFELSRFNKITSGWCPDCSKLDTILWRE